MIEIRSGKDCDAPLEKALWRQVFGDTDEYIQCYFDTCYAPEDMMLLLEGSRLASMLICLPVEIKMPTGFRPPNGEAHGSYIYALATAPDARGKGYAHRLLEFTHAHLRERGQTFSVTVPAMDSLFDFFQSAGLSPYFVHQQQQLTREVLPQAAGYAEPCDAAAYHHARSTFAFHQPSIAYPHAHILWQRQVSQLANADLYRITGNAVGYAAAERTDADTVTLKELLLENGDVLQAVAVLSVVLPAHTYVVRTPAHADGLTDGVRRFGSIAWYDDMAARAVEAFPYGYLGLGFD